VNSAQCVTWTIQVTVADQQTYAESKQSRKEAHRDVFTTEDIDEAQHSSTDERHVV